MNKFLKLSACGLLAASNLAFAAEGQAPNGIPHLDHVFLIMMENHGASQILNNPNAPFINQLAASANLATNYFAIGHPSLTNYLEVVGGSNFGVRSDNYPSWHDASCSPNLATGIAATDNPASAKICPIGGVGADAATPAVDTTNEAQGLPGENDIDGILSVPAASYTVGKPLPTNLLNTACPTKAIRKVCRWLGLTTSISAMVTIPIPPISLPLHRHSIRHYQPAASWPCMPSSTTRLFISAMCNPDRMPATA